MELLRITSPHPYLDLVQVWYEEAFPVEERRDFGDLVALLSHPTMHLSVLLHESEPVGFIIYWHWTNDGVLFIEHFAIDPTRRGQQLGQQALALILVVPANYILLETERPTDILRERRIRFYERQGFQVADCPYAQPPYRPGSSAIPMNLLSIPAIKTQADFERLTGIVHKRVYGV